ncbi:EexN family lipoprotein [uncultured Roseobacter sp.]|uniref:EexN family lipoprotein n=1 Tax=uncultured Roseobacter sp. TaxID=114847 RepID=UPI0026130281|nr:EexN family lipoprotein [uncultured Roseobacter sp.]
MANHINSFAIIALLAVSACKEEENRTVEFYLQNADVRAEMLAKCEVIDGSVLEANCRNAQEAEVQSAQETSRKKNLSDMNTLFGD